MYTSQILFQSDFSLNEAVHSVCQDELKYFAEFINRLLHDIYSNDQHLNTALNWSELSRGERTPSHIYIHVLVCMYLYCCPLMLLGESHRATLPPEAQDEKNDNGTFKNIFILLTFCHLSASVLFLPLPPRPLCFREVNRATSSWLPNMKRFPKVQDSSLISSRALRLPASPALLRLSLSIHLPLLALSPAAHLLTPFTGNTTDTC